MADKGESEMKQIINKGCKGHYWTEKLTKQDMKATKEEQERYFDMLEWER